MSSAGPNAQNAPKSLEHFMLPADGHVFIEFDNAQLEVRVAAALSGDSLLREACMAGDFHGDMMEKFGIVDRRDAKVWVFETMYGGVNPISAEVRRRMPQYFRWYQEQYARREFEGLCGRWHVVPPGQDEDRRGRQAVNDPIQAGAGTVTKWQMLKLYEAGFTLRRQVHDSIRVEVTCTQAKEAEHEMKYIMENAVDIGVPILVEGGVV